MRMEKYRRLRDLREDKDWSQAYVGKQINISQRTYAYYEAGAHVIPPDILCALAQLYGVSVDYLLNLTDEKRPYPKKCKNIG